MCCKYLDMKMLQVKLQHDCVVAVSVVSQVVVHVVDWVLHTLSLVPHTELGCCCCWNTLPPTSPDSHHHVVADFVAVDVASYLSSSCSWRFRCCCWPWISALSSWRWKCCRCSCRTKPPASHTMPLKMLNVASYLPHHIVAVAVVVLASNTPMSKIHFCMFNIGKHLITMLLLLLLLNLTSNLAFISSRAILMLMAFSSSHISIVTEKLSTPMSNSNIWENLHWCQPLWTRPALEAATGPLILLGLVMTVERPPPPDNLVVAPAVGAYWGLCPWRHHSHQIHKQCND